MENNMIFCGLSQIRVTFDKLSFLWSSIQRILMGYCLATIDSTQQRRVPQEPLQNIKDELSKISDDGSY